MEVLDGSGENHYFAGGGSSGGGSINIFVDGKYSNSGTVEAKGVQAGGVRPGGAGGNGTVNVGKNTDQGFIYLEGETTNKFEIKESEIEDDTEINEFTNIVVDYPDKKSTDKTYYKIGENGEWYQFTDNIQLDMTAIENVTDEAGNKGTSLIYIKKEDESGNVITIAKEIEINSTAYNPISNIRYKGEEAENYFTKETPSSQFIESYIGNNYLIPYFGYGHWYHSGSYYSTFKIEWSKLGLKKSNKIKISFNHYRENTSDAVETYAQVYYTDGTSSELKESTYESNEKWTTYSGTETRTSVILDLDETKIIDYIIAKINVWDSYGGSAYGIIRDIVFFGASK